MKGYFGKILRVDLTSKKVETEHFDETFARKYIGGNGFAAKYIYDFVDPKADPLSSENVVVIATGPMTGGHVWGAGRGHMASISPLTGLFCDSNFGGNFATMLKRTGYDGVVIQGAAEAPLYLSMIDGNVQLKDASGLWGLDTHEAHQLIIEENGKKTETALIGPAGENGIRYGCVICSGTRVSAAGRGGIGAVLGSKKLKGIAVRGDSKVEIAQQNELKDYLSQRLPGLREKAAGLTAMGTPVLVNIINDKGKLCTRNNMFETFDDAGKISGQLIEEKYKKKNIACFGCPIACGKLVSVPEGRFSGQHVKMAEYETLYSIGSMLENSDISSIFNANTMCDYMGLDTISFGVTLSFLAECIEKKLISPDELELPIEFNKFANLDEIVRITGRKEGRLGELMAMGSRAMSEEIGRDSFKYLYHVKGMEIAGHSARGLRQMGIGYATATRGGSHHDTRPNYYPDDPEVDPGFDHMPEYAFNSQNNTAIRDSLVICAFIYERAFGTQLNQVTPDVLNYITGWDITLEEIVTAAERIYTLERLINVNRGADRAADTLPYRVMNEPIPDGPSKGWYCSPDDLSGMLDAYYKMREWDSNGIPGKNKLEKLGLA